MLKRLRVKNFRLLRDVDVDFDLIVPTVFIGPNGSGKSTILEVLDFLGRCGESGLEAAVSAHGGIASIRTSGSEGSVEVEATWAFRTDSLTTRMRSWELVWSVALSGARNGAAIVARESLTDQIEPAHHRALVNTDDKGARWVHPESESGGKPSQIKLSNQLAFQAYVDAERFRGLHLLKGIVAGVNVIGALSTAPGWGRNELVQPSPRDTVVIGPKDFLDRQGVGLANVLYNLFTNHADAWNELEHAFRGEFPFVRRIVFPPDVGGSRISFAFEDIRFPGRKFYSSEMSDGMIAFLCLLAAVINPKQGGLLGLDEPDANLHPSALRRLMSVSHREHSRRRLAIVTHSNALLDELREPGRSIRIVESTQNGAVIRRLDAEALAMWRKDYTISEMRRTGLLDPSNTSYEGKE